MWLRLGPDHRGGPHGQLVDGVGAGGIAVELGAGGGVEGVRAGQGAVTAGGVDVEQQLKNLADRRESRWDDARTGWWLFIGLHKFAD